MSQFLEYQVVEAFSTSELKKLVEKAMNQEGWKLHGGVSVTHMGTVSTGNWSAAERWVLHQSMVRGNGGRAHAEKVQSPYNPCHRAFYEHREDV